MKSFFSHTVASLASSNWRLKFGRRNGEQLFSVDPTGSYCAMPDDWIKKKLADAAVRPTNEALFKSEFTKNSHG